MYAKLYACVLALWPDPEGDVAQRRCAARWEDEADRLWVTKRVPTWSTVTDIRLALLLEDFPDGAGELPLVWACDWR